MEILGLIPARAGSKRIKNKNIKLLGGKPLIAYTIEAALKSKLLNKVIVSTDSKKIATISKKCGAEVPFLRPKKISTANSTEFEFHLHALEWLKVHENYTPDIIVNLYPTTPFRKTATIDSAIELFLHYPEVDSLRSIKICTEHPYKMWVFKNTTYINPFVKTENISEHTSSYHLLPQIYIQNASIYIVRKEVVYKFKNTVGNNVLGFVMNDLESLDINNPLDLQNAETLVERIFNQ